MRQSERDQGVRFGLTTEQLEELRELRRENRELRRANEIAKSASAYFAQADASTAYRADDRVCGLAPRNLWGRADLRPVSDRPVNLSASTPADNGILVGVRRVRAGTPKLRVRFKRGHT